jgi:MFS family permease
LVIFVTVFIDLLGFGIVLPILPRYAEHFHVSKMTLGLLMASFSAMQFLFAPIWGRISDRVGRRPILILGLAGSAFFLHPVRIRHVAGGGRRAAGAEYRSVAVYLPHRRGNRRGNDPHGPSLHRGRDRARGAG